MHAAGGVLHGAFQDEIDAETAADVTHRFAGQREDRRAGRDPDAAQRTQPPADVCGQPAADLPAVRTTSDDFEGQHGERCLAAVGRRGRRRLNRRRRLLQRLEIGAKCPGRLIAIIGPLGEEPVDNLLQGLGVFRREAAHGEVRFAADQRDDIVLRGAFERPGAGRHLVQHGAG